MYVYYCNHNSLKKTDARWDGVQLIYLVMEMCYGTNPAVISSPEMCHIMACTDLMLLERLVNLTGMLI